MLSLLGYGGRVVRVALALTGLQRVGVALQLDVARGQGHVMRPLRVPVDLRRFGLELVRVEMLAAFRRGGHVDDPYVRDAGLPQDLL